jgi:glutathione S-transferase
MKRSVAESYASSADRSTPVPPELSDPHSGRFQFSLRQLLALMLASAFLAAGLRYVLQWLERLPQHYLTGLQNTLLLGIAFGGLLYFFFRAPFLVYGGVRTMRRWQAMQRHRRELTAWAAEVRERRKAEQAANAAEQPSAPE